MRFPTNRTNYFKIGDFECHILYDGSRSIGSMTSGQAKRFLFGDVADYEFDHCVTKHGGFDSHTVLPFNYLLVNHDDKYTLIDTGCGDQAENEKHLTEPVGFLMKSISEINVSFNDIETVIISHWHWDHFGGALRDGEVAFPRAEFVMSRKESEYIFSMAKGWAANYLSKIDDRLNLVGDVTTVHEGITLKVKPGHTPGISIVEISSKGETLLYTSDLLIHPAHIEHTNWIPSFENDHLTAMKSRKELVEESHKNNLLLFVPHIPGILGRIRKNDFGYHWAPEII